MKQIEQLRALAAESEPDAAEVLNGAADTMAELLAALNTALSGAEHHPACRASRGRDIGNRCDCWVRTARAAIAKTERP